MRILSWNVARKQEAWRWLLDSDADVALLQEAVAPPADIAGRFEVDPLPWQTAGEGLNRPWRAAVVRLSSRVNVQWLEQKPLADARPGELGVSRSGTLSAAVVTPADDEPTVVVSMYAAWEKPHNHTGSGWIYADASAHRVLSDLSVLIGSQSKHQIIAAGDLNILYGHGEHGSVYWAQRYGSVFARMETLGLDFVGPQAPGGRMADPWPVELPKDSRNVPTYRARHQTPQTATRQLDFVFASQRLAPYVQVTALNEPESWGPSDHCRVEIVVGRA